MLLFLVASTDFRTLKFSGSKKYEFKMWSQFLYTYISDSSDVFGSWPSFSICSDLREQIKNNDWVLIGIASSDKRRRVIIFGLE